MKVTLISRLEILVSLKYLTFVHQLRRLLQLQRHEKFCFSITMPLSRYQSFYNLESEGVYNTPSNLNNVNFIIFYSKNDGFIKIVRFFVLIHISEFFYDNRLQLLPCASNTVSSSNSMRATIEFGFSSGASCPNGTK